MGYRKTNIKESTIVTACGRSFINPKTSEHLYKLHKKKCDRCQEAEMLERELTERETLLLHGVIRR